MEYDGLLSRTDHGGNPPHVECALTPLTPLGHSLLGPLRAVREWAETHVPDIEAARADAVRSTGSPTEAPDGRRPRPRPSR